MANNLQDLDLDGDAQAADMDEEIEALRSGAVTRAGMLASCDDLIWRDYVDALCMCAGIEVPS